MQSIATSDGESKYDTWISSPAASTREFMKHASIDPCTRLRKNSNYTELMHYLIVYIYVLLLTVNILSKNYIIYSYRHLLQ